MLDRIFREYFQRKEIEGGFSRADMYFFVQRSMSEGYKKSSILNMLSRMRSSGMSVPTMNGKGDVPLYESFAEFMENNPVEGVSSWIESKRSEGYKDNTLYQKLKDIQKGTPELGVPSELQRTYKASYESQVNLRNRDLIKMDYTYAINLLSTWLSGEQAHLFCGLLLACGRRTGELFQDFKVDGYYCTIGKQTKIKHQVDFSFPLTCEPDLFVSSLERFRSERFCTEMHYSSKALPILKQAGLCTVKDLRALYAALAYKKFGYGISEQAFYSDVLGHTGSPSYATSTYTRFLLT